MKYLIFGAFALFAFSSVAQVGTPPGGTKTIIVNAAESAVYANQKCVRAAGQAGPADTRFIRVIEGNNHRGCIVQLERAANAGPGAKSNFQDLYKSNNVKPAIAGVAEVTTFTFSQAGSFYDVVGTAKAIQVYDGTNGHFFYFKVTGGAHVQTAPVLVGQAHEVDVLPGDTAAQVAAKYNAVLIGGFTSSVSGVLVTMVAPNKAPSTDASATGSAAAIAIPTQGAAPVPADWSQCNKQANTETGNLKKHAYTCANE